MKYKVLSSPEYTAGELRITTIESTYIQLIRIWRNQQIAFLRQHQIISPEQQNDYFESWVFPFLESEAPVQVLFNCFYDNQFVGYGGIVHISYEDKIGEISFLLDPQIKSGSLYESIFLRFLKLMDRIAFNEIGLYKLFTETFSSRMEHVPMLEKAGYQREGVRRSHLLINAEKADIYLHGRLADDVTEHE
jgi:RimJ/RimL family protein N-acetyltransferase